MKGYRFSSHFSYVSYEQVNRMLDFMESHADLANNDTAMQGRRFANKLWLELTIGLNGTLGGTKKSVNGWRRYWRDFRHDMRNKVLLTRNRPAGRVPVPLNKLERKAVQVLEPYFKRKEHDQEMRVMEIDKVELEDNSSSSSSSSSSDCDSQSGFSDCASDTDSSASQPIILQTSFPNWLARVEQKRAEAELARARADEVYARSAEHAASAAQAQADALSCLARATTAQADALERIAAVLDRSDHLIDF